MAKKKARDYSAEYQRDHASAKSKKDRAARNKARREAEKEGRVKKGDGMEVHHPSALSRGGSPNQKTKVVSRSTNRKIGNKTPSEAKKSMGKKKK